MDFEWRYPIRSVYEAGRQPIAWLVGAACRKSCSDSPTIERPRKMFVLTRKMLAAAVPLLALARLATASAAGQEPAWPIVLHPKDFVIGASLTGLHTRHTWVDHFDDKTGSFDVAVSKKAVAIPAPQCRMDYLIL